MMTKLGECRILSGGQDWPLWAQGSGRPPAWGSTLQPRARVLDSEATVAGKATEVWLTCTLQKLSPFSKVREGDRSQAPGAAGPGGKRAPPDWGHLLKTCLMNSWKDRGGDPNQAQEKP